MKRRKFTSEFKTKVVLEVLKETNTLGGVAQKYQLHPQQITKWKKHFLVHASVAFGQEKKDIRSEVEKELDELLRTIGELKVENDFLKKRLK